MRNLAAEKHGICFVYHTSAAQNKGTAVSSRSGHRSSAMHLILRISLIPNKSHPNGVVDYTGLEEIRLHFAVQNKGTAASSRSGHRSSAMHLILRISSIPNKGL